MHNACSLARQNQIPQCQVKSLLDLTQRQISVNQ